MPRLSRRSGLRQIDIDLPKIAPQHRDAVVVWICLLAQVVDSASKDCEWEVREERRTDEVRSRIRPGKARAEHGPGSCFPSKVPQSPSFPSTVFCKSRFQSNDRLTELKEKLRIQWRSKVWTICSMPAAKDWMSTTYVCPSPEEKMICRWTAEKRQFLVYRKSSSELIVCCFGYSNAWD